MIKFFIKIKDSESELKKNHELMEGFWFSHDDEMLNRPIKAAIEEFGRKPEEVQITIKADW
jgi:uncharacterized protein YneF (UPF0154 family)